MDRRSAWIPVDTFGLRLRLLRHDLGLSVEEAAARCGISTATWSSWERGSNPRRMDGVVARIVEATGVDRDWLMWGGSLTPSTKWWTASQAAHNLAA